MESWGDFDVDATLVHTPLSPSKRRPLALSVDAVDAAWPPPTRRASGVDMDRVRLIKTEPDDLAHLRVSGDDVVLEQLLADDPLVATIAAAQEFATSSEEESQSDTSSVKRDDTQAHILTTAKAAVAATVPDDEIGLTPLEIRRKRNRESMQRARARQRSDIESMKVVMRQLEAHFQKLSEEKEHERRDASTDLIHVRHPLVHVETQYRHLADASRRLKEEKFLLEKMLTEKTKTFRRLQQAMVDRTAELGIHTPLNPEVPASLATSLSARLTVDFFTPITEQQADSAIKRCYEDIVRLEKMSKPLHNGANEQTPHVLPPSATFGWSMMCHMLPADTGFFVTFTKSFPHETPDDVMLKTWTLFSRPENNAGAEKRNGVMRMDTLQVVNDNAYVAYRDVQHPSNPGKTLRTVFLRFRLQTEEGGFVIGRACMNPTNSELRALEEREGNIVYGDFSSWIEFRTPSEGSLGCEVKFGAILAYNTHEDMHLRLINTLMTTIMWETTVIKALFCVQDSTSE